MAESRPAAGAWWEMCSFSVGAVAWGLSACTLGGVVVGATTDMGGGITSTYVRGTMASTPSSVRTSHQLLSTSPTITTVSPGATLTTLLSDVAEKGYSMRRSVPVVGTPGVCVVVG